MRTAEYLNILQSNFPDNIEIESIETETEWGTTYYEFAVYIWDIVFNQLNKKEEITFKNDGIVPFMNKEGVFVSDSFDEAVKDLFNYCYEKGLLE